MVEIFRVIVSPPGQTDQTTTYFESDMLSLALKEAHTLVDRGLPANSVDVLQKDIQTGSWISIWQDSYVDVTETTKNPFKRTEK